MGSEGMVGDDRSARLKISDSFKVQLFKKSISSLEKDGKFNQNW
jgi:hypothetical protein